MRKTCISVGWKDPSNPEMRGAFPCEARILRDVTVRKAPGPNADKVDGVHSLRKGLTVTVHAESDDAMYLHITLYGDTLAQCDGWVKVKASGDWRGKGKDFPTLSVYSTQVRGHTVQ